MSTVYTTCPHCASRLLWSWEEAFEKFGFGDGDEIVMTEAVADALRNQGYTVIAEPWGMHNTVITSIVKDGIEQIPDSASVGYDEPREYLPDDIVRILDEAFPEGREVQP